MLNDIILFLVLNCYEILLLIDSFNLLFNSGDVNLVFYYDGLENIFIVIFGIKIVYLVNSIYIKDFYVDKFIIVLGVLSIDLEKLDLEIYLKLVDVFYYEVILNKGECF